MKDQINPDYLLKTNLKGKIKRVIETTWKTDGVKPIDKNKDDISESLFAKFNPDGKLTDYIFHKIEDKDYKKYIFKYDDSGNEIEKNLYTLEGNLIYKRVPEFNNSGKLIGYNYYLQNGFCISSTKFVFDKNGVIIKEITSNYDGRLMSEENYTYLDQFKISNFKNYGDNGKVELHVQYKFDPSGNPVEFAYKDLIGGKKFKQTILYDSKGNDVDNMIYTISNKLESRSTSKYDEDGNLIENINYIADGSIESVELYKYEFDNLSNWIFREEFNSSSLLSFTERTIDYY